MTSYTWQPNGPNVFQLNYHGTTRIFHHIVCSGHQLPLTVIAAPFYLRRFPGQTFFYFEVEIDCLSHQLQAQQIVSKAREEAQSILNDLPRSPSWSFQQNPVTIKRSDVDILDASVKAYANLFESSARNSAPLQSQAPEQDAEDVSQPLPQANHLAHAQSSRAGHEESDPASSQILGGEITQSNSSPPEESPSDGEVQPSKRRKFFDQELEVNKLMSQVVNNVTEGVQLLREDAHVVDLFRTERSLSNQGSVGTLWIRYSTIFLATRTQGDRGRLKQGG
ncbi:hypothetical protein KC338_g9476 [Hortaea werneckii]|nr:hypothetical protein KC323_g9489 [Hortaea werneckii]KAI6853688.1 hypothetical protein KC338_g9476 [Hortaea werneckii]KAI7057981.1 hypothetical protein KC339_g17766 [Hortaea werneckii]KAI7201694.1 hypothetical protein KC365_g18659 [Hortaea werneckii]